MKYYVLTRKGQSNRLRNGSLVTVSPRLYPETLASSRSECWEKAFGVVGEEIDDLLRNQDANRWVYRYWKRWNESKRSARHYGFVIREAKVVLV